MFRTKERSEPDHTTRTAFFIVALLLISAAAMRNFPEFRRYMRIRPFMRKVLDDLTIGVMQSENDAKRIRNLGLNENRISVSGNLKFDSAAIYEYVAARQRESIDGSIVHAMKFPWILNTAGV